MATIKGSRTQRKAPKSRKGKPDPAPIKELDCKDLEQASGGTRPPGGDDDGSGGGPGSGGNGP